MEVLHYPRLDTILMVEDTIRKLDFYPSKKELWVSLPKKVQYQTFKIIIDYLIDSGKIMLNKRKLIWIYNPDLIKKSVEIEL